MKQADFTMSWLEVHYFQLSFKTFKLFQINVFFLPTLSGLKMVTAVHCARVNRITGTTAVV